MFMDFMHIFIVIVFITLIYKTWCYECLQKQLYSNKFAIFRKSSEFPLYYKLKKELLDGPSIPDSNLRVKVGSQRTKIISGGTKKRRIWSQGQPRMIELNNPNKLRVIAGIAKGKKIDSPDVHLRPMMAKVRGALFNSLESIGMFLSGSTRILDVFSGSGSIGLEALSRGANHATFVDLSQNCIDTSLANAKRLGFESQVSAVCASAMDVLSQPSNFSLIQSYNIVTLTPPYEEIVYKDLIDSLVSSPLISQDSVAVIEYPVEMTALPFIISGKLFGLRNRRYGRTILATYVNNPTKHYEMRPDEFQTNR